MNRLTIVLFLAIAPAAVRAGTVDDPLDAAKSLYLSASYEEALTALGNLPSSVDSDQADKFRALCFLALNRTQDAQQALERLAARRPLLKFDEGESPKLVSMFRDARARVLPTAAKNMYASAKANFEQGQITKAATQFDELIALLSEKELASQPGLVDLKMLAEGFSKLTQQQISVEHAAASAAEKPAPAAAAAVEPPPAEPAKIFTSADVEVRPPIAIEQTIPQWVPPTGNLRYQEFSGVLEIVVDESGSVINATMAQRVNVIYDQMLMSAAKRWRYHPALRDGKPVIYRKLINIMLRPSGPGGQSVPGVSD
jgi:tetratricopeptide (TPR) repeat protein